MTTTARSDQGTALTANRVAFDAIDERRLVAASPHLRHPSIRRLYEQIIDESIGSMPAICGALTLLELGAGDGLASRPWFARGADVTAVDCSESMLSRLAARARTYGSEATIVVGDALQFLRSCDRKFDVVSHISVLHHIPDYLDWLQQSIRVIRRGGWLLTFQDPLRYDLMPRKDRMAERAAYFAWRLTQGSYMRGLQTRIRRLRGVYKPGPADFDEYHVVRNGVDSDAIIALLTPYFGSVKRIEYWSTQGAVWQALGARLGIRSCFGIVASDRKS